MISMPSGGLVRNVWPTLLDEQSQLDIQVVNKKLRKTKTYE